MLAGGMMPVELVVRNSGFVQLQRYSDRPDGDLFIIEAERQVPFAIRRVYFINNLGNPTAVRGKHAHRKLRQAIFAINGTFELGLDDGTCTQRLTMDDPACGVFLGPMLWHTMTAFSPECVILVLADEWYDAADYIRDYQQFRTLANEVG